MFKSLSISSQLVFYTLGWVAIATQPALAQQRDLTWRDGAYKVRPQVTDTAPRNFAVTLAQITPDNTTGTQVNQNGNVSEITGGEIRGGNLFHSFQDFSVTTGNTAFFENANSISNIFSRVTGGNISNIDGVLGANGSANLFLINPAGIIFGENARLDIGGSFLASTSSGILFEDGEFSATDLENPPLLTVNAPIGLNFRDNPGDIAVRGANLSVAAGQSISLLGGGVELDGANVTALGGQVNLGGLSSSGTVSFGDDNLDFSNGSLADITLNNDGRVNVNGNGGGNIAVNARNLTLSGGSIFSGGINDANSTENTQAGNITLNVEETVTLNSASLIRNNISDISAGNAGDIIISANNLSLNDESRLSTISQGNGNTGDITLDISDSITLNRTAEFKSQILNNGVGNTGDININTGLLTVNENSAIFTSIFGEGNAGDINIVASDRVIIDGSVLQARVAASGVGNSGNIDITTGSLLLRNTTNGNNFSQILSDTEGEGNAGTITVEATNDVSLEDSSFFLTEVAEGGVGDAGDINITTTNLSLLGDTAENPASLITNSRGVGNAGNININASGDLNFDTNTSILSQLLSTGVGNGGNIDVSANSLNLNDANWITNTRGEGNAGGITIDVAEGINLTGGSLILSQVLENGGRGDAGDINITAGSLSLTNSLIIADSSDLGSGGDINITTAGNIVLQGAPEGTDELSITDAAQLPSSIITGLNEFIDPETRQIVSSGQGTAGNINISADRLILTDLASISSNVEGSTVGNGGEITLNLNLLRLENNAAIGTYTVSEFDAGSINVNTQNLELFSGGKLITATDGAGNAGTIDLAIADNITIDNELAEAAPTFIFNDDIVNELQGQTGLFANATDTSTGNGGNISINRDLASPNTNISLLNGSQIRADGGVDADAGNIFISANSLSLDTNSIVVAETVSNLGANINLQLAEQLTLNNSSSISAQAFNSGNGGNLTIDTQFIVAFPNGNNDIIANAEQGQGGNIQINARSLFGIEERPLDDSTNDINASSEFSLDGTVTIETPDLNPVQGAVDLPNNVITPEQSVAQACKADRAPNGQNSLTLQGKGGIPPVPTSTLDSQNISIQGKLNSATISNPPAISIGDGKIQPARGVTVTPEGEIILTAYPTDSFGNRLPHNKLNCGV